MTQVGRRRVAALVVGAGVGGVVIAIVAEGIGLGSGNGTFVTWQKIGLAMGLVTIVGGALWFSKPGLVTIIGGPLRFSASDLTIRDALFSLVMVCAAVAGVIIYRSIPDPHSNRESAWICLAAAGTVLIVNQVRRAGRPKSHPGTLLALGGMSLVALSLAADSLNLGSGYGIGGLQVAGALVGGAAMIVGIRLRRFADSESGFDDVATWLVPRVLAASIAITVIAIAATKLTNDPACPPRLAGGGELVHSSFNEGFNELYCLYSGSNEL